MYVTGCTIPIDGGSLAIKRIFTTPDDPMIYFTKIEDVKGMIPLVSIVDKQAITSNMVAKPNTPLGAQSEFLPIPSGYVALTIPTSEQQGVAGNIQPDDYISVIATVTSGSKVASKTVFVNLHVIRVGMEGPAGGAAAGATATSLTVVVTECHLVLDLRLAQVHARVIPGLFAGGPSQGSDVPKRHLGDGRHPADGAEGLPEPFLGSIDGVSTAARGLVDHRRAAGDRDRGLLLEPGPDSKGAHRAARCSIDTPGDPPRTGRTPAAARR